MMKQMDVSKRSRITLTGVLVAVMLGALVVIVAGLGLLTKDVRVPIEGNDGVPNFCGSAYDVTWLKKDGYMGGEMPPNQAEIDRACIEKASHYSYRGRTLVLTGAASLAVASVAVVALWVRRSRVIADQKPV
jgi:hypothetical protein